MNQTFARKIFGERPPSAAISSAGKTISEVVGVVEDGKYDIADGRSRTGHVFSACATATTSDTTLVVRSQLPPAEITASAINRMLTGIDPSLPFTLRSWPAALASFCSRRAWPRLRWASWACLAAMLAITGVFGMAAYGVQADAGTRHSRGARRAPYAAHACGAGPSADRCWCRVRLSGCSSACSPAGCSRRLSIRRHRAILWCWPE